jgi:hypothetical protein
MSTASQDPQEDPVGTSPSGHADEDRKRCWYHLRPSPRCAADLAGFNWSYWLLIVFIVLVFLPPW